jgi:hypothetical protein
MPVELKLLITVVLSITAMMIAYLCIPDRYWGLKDYLANTINCTAVVSSLAAVARGIIWVWNQ